MTSKGRATCFGHVLDAKWVVDVVSFILLINSCISLKLGEDLDCAAFASSQSNCEDTETTSKPSKFRPRATRY